MPNAAYDITTLLGQVRFHAADTAVTDDVDNATFSDGELAYCLAQSGQNAMLAAALALDALASDSARMASLIKTQSIASDPQKLAAALCDQAKSLRVNAGLGGSIEAPDRAFEPEYNNGACPGNMEIW